MKTCYIIGAGEFFGTLNPGDDDFVIAADGGYTHLIQHGVRCDLLVGDFDSLTALPPELPTLRFPIRKDETDTYLAYRLGVERGYTDFCIYGGTGGRPDHTFANYALLYHAALAGHSARLVGNGFVTEMLLSGTRVLQGKAGTHLSLFAFGGIARGVSVRGAEYNAENINLTPDFPLGVSNSFTHTPCEISVSEGSLLIMRQTDSPDAAV